MNNKKEDYKKEDLQQFMTVVKYKSREKMINKTYPDKLKSGTWQDRTEK